MKKALILTSIFALAACSGGSGSVGTGGGHIHGASSTPTSGFIFTPIPSLNETETVNHENAGVTGMTSSTVTNETEVRSSMISYVLSRMPGVYTAGNLSALWNNRGASNRNLRDGAELTDEQKFFIANTKMNAMKNTLTEMAAADDLEAYVATHESEVAEALLLFGEDIDLQNIDPDLLLSEFNTIIDGTTIADAISTFEATNNMVYDRAMLDSVRFQDAGDANAYFKFHLDGDVIDRVAMFEGDAPNDYGWFTKTDDEAGNVFGKTLYSYKYAMESLPGGTQENPVEVVGFTDAQIAAFRWFNGVSGKDDIMNIIFRNDSNELTNAQKQDQILNVLQNEFNDFINNQNGGLPEGVNPTLAYNQYVQMINDAFYGLDEGAVVLSQTIEPLTLTVTMQGIGKDLGLKYSDLGVADLQDAHQTASGSTEYTHNYATYAGGYTDRIVNPGDNDATYTGTAVVGVQWSTTDVDGNENGDGMLLHNEGATLAYNGQTGISTLTMNNLVNDTNNKWYNVTVSGNFNGEHATDLTFTFDSTGMTTDEAYNFITNPGTVEFASNEWDSVHEMFKQTVLDENGNETNIDYRGSADANYYGPAPDMPTEAGATFHFSEEEHIPDGHGNESHHEVGMYGAFGGTK